MFYSHFSGGLHCLILVVRLHSIIQRVTSLRLHRISESLYTSGCIRLACFSL